MDTSAAKAAVYADDFLGLVLKRIGETCTDPERIRAMRRHASTGVNITKAMCDGVATCYAAGCRRYLADVPEPQARAFADHVSESGIQSTQAAVNTSKTAAVRIFASYNAKFGEVWFFYPTGSSSSANPTRYAAVSVKTGKWFLGQLARTAMAQGILFLYGATSGGVAFIHENGNKGISTDSLSWSITSGCYYLNDTQDRLMLRDVCPDFAAGSPAQSGTVSIGIGVFDRAQNDTSFSAAQTVTVPGDLTIIRRNLRVSGRLIQVQISGDDTAGTTDTSCHIGKLTFDVVKLGQR